MPLAYFITFTVYGVWLHGRETGSVDKEHNLPGTPFLPADPIREATMLANMREAPYLLDAAKSLQVHLGWVVQTYNATEALANLIHPFWMLPLLGILGLKARDIVGYSALQFAVHVPTVLFLVWILNYTLR